MNEGRNEGMNGWITTNKSIKTCLLEKMQSPPQPELFRSQPFRQAPILGVIRLDYDAGLGEFYSPAWVNHVLTGEMHAPGYMSGVRSHW